MAWGDAARAAALEARRMHGQVSKQPNSVEKAKQLFHLKTKLELLPQKFKVKPWYRQVHADTRRQLAEIAKARDKK